MTNKLINTGMAMIGLLAMITLFAFAIYLVTTKAELCDVIGNRLFTTRELTWVECLVL